MSQRGHLAASQVVCILGSIQRPLQLLLCNSRCLLQQAVPETTCTLQAVHPLTLMSTSSSRALAFSR